MTSRHPGWVKTSLTVLGIQIESNVETKYQEFTNILSQENKKGNKVSTKILTFLNGNENIKVGDMCIYMDRAPEA